MNLYLKASGVCKSVYTRVYVYEAPRAVRVSDANFQLRLAGTDYYLRCSTVKLEKNGPPCVVSCMNAVL